MFTRVLMAVSVLYVAMPYSGTTQAAPIFMSPEWAAAACEAWNAEATLTDELTDWMKNDKQRGYKIMHLFRIDCPDSPRVEMRIEGKDGKAICAYGGAVEHTELDSGADYVMSAETKRWQEMGAGEYGPMKAMMFGRLKFQGPKLEAMGNMGPFAAFLRIPGKIEADTSLCPPVAATRAPAGTSTDAAPTPPAGATN